MNMATTFVSNHLTELNHNQCSFSVRNKSYRFERWSEEETKGNALRMRQDTSAQERRCPFPIQRMTSHCSASINTKFDAPIIPLRCTIVFNHILYSALLDIHIAGRPDAGTHLHSSVVHIENPRQPPCLLTCLTLISTHNRQSRLDKSHRSPLTPSFNLCSRLPV